jgi:type II secretory pathway predicted ATPase ExeA
MAATTGIKQEEREDDGMNMTRLELFCNLEYKRDPLTGHAFETGDWIRVRRILTMAVESHAMVSIVGERGIGKTDAVEAALKKIGARVVKVHKLDKGAVKIGDIERALVFDLCQDLPKSNGEVRARQLRPIIGEAGKKRKVVLLLEEAQRLHGATLRSLKTLREIDWWGERELFTIVLVAQSDPMARAGVSEVALRSDCVRMQGLSSQEAAGYVKATVGKHFNQDAIEALAEFPEATNWLELQALIVAALNVMIAKGHEKVERQDVIEMAEQNTSALPKSPAKTTAAPVSGKQALASVLGRKTGKDDDKEAVGC